MVKIPILVDIDGVLRIGGSPADGVTELFGLFKEYGTPVCLISNSTLSSSTDLFQFFRDRGIECPFPIMTASSAAADFVKSHYSRAAVYCIPKIKKLFEDVLTETEEPDAVVMGDMGEGWDYGVLSEIFRKVRNGADLIAMQKNRFWKTPDKGYLLDLGPFVAAIEYATSKEAIIIGKPSEIYFESALRLTGAGRGERFIMIGDDIETDILAAGKLGAVTVQMYTGKTSYPLKDEYAGLPDHHSKSLYETVEILKEIMEIR